MRPYEECAFLIRNFHTISYISLDCDLGEGETGLRVLKHINVKRINVRFAQLTGASKMRVYAEQTLPNTDRHIPVCNLTK